MVRRGDSEDGSRAQRQQRRGGRINQKRIKENMMRWEIDRSSKEIPEKGISWEVAR